MDGQSYQDYCLYLVDNGSSDESPTILREKYGNHPKIKLILNSENLGFTKGNNKELIEILQQDNCPPYVVLLNNDTIVAKDWLEQLINSAKVNRADIVASKMISYHERHKMDNAGHIMLNTGEILPIGHLEPIEAYNQGFENMGACAGAALYATPMLEQIGPFDEYFNTGYEDAELGLRAIVAGYKCWYEPKAIVYHKMGQSIKKIFDSAYAAEVQKNILYTYFKTLPFGILVINVPFLLVRYIGIMGIHLIFGRIDHLKIFWKAWKQILEQRSIIKTARRNFFSRTLTILPISKIQKKLSFFIPYDLLRFYTYFVKKKKGSSLEKYGN